MFNQLQTVFLGVALGVLLAIIGIGAESKWVLLIGELIIPIALVWGSLFFKDESNAMRAVMLAVAGVIIAVTIQSGGLLSSLLSYY
ncbi:MAG TPA: hypothetical protein G4O10_11080 [Dehalococcoidia bacterium]|nr:hypothetical protein [Dehalococcoidia bacterium]